jgi:hypothetical protein
MLDLIKTKSGVYLLRTSRVGGLILEITYKGYALICTNSADLNLSSS